MSSQIIPEGGCEDDENESSTSQQVKMKSVNGQAFTFRSIAVGIGVGSILCSSNMYFGLQTGWVTMGSLQSTLLGYAIFKAFQRCGLGQGFSVGENVIIQTTSVAVAMIPITSGLISVIPALEMLTETDNPDGSVSLSTLELVLWTLSVAFFGAFAAVPLRQQTVVREKLPFPGGTATAKVIQLLHQRENGMVYYRFDDTESHADSESSEDDIERALIPTAFQTEESIHKPKSCTAYSLPGDWMKSVVYLIISFAFSFGYKLLAEFVVVNDASILASFPIFSWMGWETATIWGWVLYPAFGYIGQGMITGPKTCLSMGLGALTGFAILGPIARRQSWAPGDIESIDDGATGWVLWISLAVMLGDSLTSLLLLALKTMYLRCERKREYEEDAEGEVPRAWWVIGIIATTILTTAIVAPLFSMTVYEPGIAVLLAALISILAVRALGETDFNPASGIGKISQIVFSFIAPGKVVANLVAGAIAEAGAIQAGDMMQDFKTAYLLGIPPKPQFYAQLIGSFVSVFVSVAVYKLYRIAWTFPSDELPVPSANVWIDMARLFNGGSLPAAIPTFAILFAVAAMLNVFLEKWFSQKGRSCLFLPSGIGFAIGMYVAPKFTLARILGSLAQQIWLKRNPTSHATLMVVVASGFVLGEGIAAIVVALVRMFRTIL